MIEKTIENFWHTHPCGENLVKPLAKDYEDFFSTYDTYRYRLEKHIPRCLEQLDLSGKELLEIGLGQGADSELLARQGARWSGLDLTQESVERVRTRFQVRGLPFGEIKKGSVLEIPWPDNHFDVVYSHGVLHHVPEIKRAQAEIARVIKPEGRLVIMLYAKYSLNYLVSISLLRRLALGLLYWKGSQGPSVLDQHIRNAKEAGLLHYLNMKNFIHRNTDGPGNPYSKVYSVAEVKKDFPDFKVVRAHKEFMHAPPLPVHGWPGASVLGWHLWVHLAPAK